MKMKSCVKYCVKWGDGIVASLVCSFSFVMQRAFCGGTRVCGSLTNAQCSTFNQLLSHQHSGVPHLRLGEEHVKCDIHCGDGVGGRSALFQW